MTFPKQKARLEAGFVAIRKTLGVITLAAQLLSAPKYSFQLRCLLRADGFPTLPFALIAPPPDEYHYRSNNERCEWNYVAHTSVGPLLQPNSRNKDRQSSQRGETQDHLCAARQFTLIEDCIQGDKHNQQHTALSQAFSS